MNKKMALLFIMVMVFFQGMAQKSYFLPTDSKVLLLEKLGSGKKFTYREGDYIKLSTNKKMIMNGYLWKIEDSSILIDVNRPLLIKDVSQVYPQFRFLQKLGKYLFGSGIVYFSVVSLNHLFYNEKVFTKDVFVVPTTLFAAGLITVWLSEKQCRIGQRWKLKVLEIRLL